MKLAVRGGGICHAPEFTRAALISAFVAGAQALRLPLRLTSDRRLVVFEDETTDRLTGKAARVAQLSLKDMRALDVGSSFKEADGSTVAYPARVESFGMLLDVLPADIWLILDLK